MHSNYLPTYKLYIRFLVIYTGVRPKTVKQQLQEHQEEGAIRREHEDDI